MAELDAVDVVVLRRRPVVGRGRVTLLKMFDACHSQQFLPVGRPVRECERVLLYCAVRALPDVVVTHLRAALAPLSPDFGSRSSNIS